jgi:hypothetical protein
LRFTAFASSERREPGPRERGLLARDSRPAGGRAGIAKLARLGANGLDVELFQILTFT